MITVSDKNLKRFERMLGDMRDTSVKFAQRNTLNDIAFDARKNAVENIKKDFVNRNTFTQRQLRVERARYTGDSAELGHLQEYMEKQENSGKGAKYIPSPASAGQSNKARKRTKSIRKANYMNAIGRAYKVKKIAGSLKEQNISYLKQAKEAGAKTVILNKGNGRGIGLYRVMGSKRKPKSRLLYTLLKANVPIKKHPWMQPAADKTMNQKAKNLYFNRLRQELKRLEAKARLTT